MFLRIRRVTGENVTQLLVGATLVLAFESWFAVDERERRRPSIVTRIERTVSNFEDPATGMRSPPLPAKESKTVPRDIAFHIEVAGGFRLGPRLLIGESCQRLTGYQQAPRGSGSDGAGDQGCCHPCGPRCHMLSRFAPRWRMSRRPLLDRRNSADLVPPRHSS